MRWQGAAIAALAAVATTSCATQTSSPGALADRMTRAIYADDLDAASANFDDETKPQVSRGSLGAISDRMHALGDLQSLVPRSADPDRGRYEYDARFTNGALLVQLRIDPSGKVGAYRVVEELPAR